MENLSPKISKMDINKKFSVLCSYGILSDKNLTAIDVRVYLYIKFRWQFFMKNSLDFNESVETIASATNTSKRSVINSINNLKKQGYLDVKERKGKTNLYIPKTPKE